MHCHNLNCTNSKYKELFLQIEWDQYAWAVQGRRNYSKIWNELHGTFVRPYWSLKGPLVILGIFRVGRCFVVILLQFQIFGTDFGLQKLNWDNFVMAHTNFLRVFSGFQWKFTVLFKILIFPGLDADWTRIWRGLDADWTRIRRGFNAEMDAQRHFLKRTARDLRSSLLIPKRTPSNTRDLQSG